MIHEGYPRQFAAASLKRAHVPGRQADHRGYPRQFAAASLKLQPDYGLLVSVMLSAAVRRGLIEASGYEDLAAWLTELSAAVRRGLIEAVMVCGLPTLPHDVIRGSSPRPH